MFPVRLETPRLVLREFLRSDLDAMHAYASDPEVSRYEGWGPNTREDTERFLSSVVLPAQSTEPRTTYELAIEVKGLGLVGGCGMRVSDPGNRTSDLGYVLTRAQWGKGFMPEAITAFLEFSFATLGLHRIWATTDTRNIRSKRVLEKVGMRHEGCRKANQFRRGEWTDSHLYATLEDEWRGRHLASSSPAPAVTVRPATKDDYAGISALFTFVDDLHQAARPDLFRAVGRAPRSAEHINGLISDDDVLLLVVEGTSGLLAVAVSYLKTVDASSVIASRTFVLLDDLVTHPEHRRHGIGRSLVRAVEKWAEARGADSVELGVYEFNVGAREFYERLGYGTMTRRLEKRIVGRHSAPEESRTG